MTKQKAKKATFKFGAHVRVIDKGFYHNSTGVLIHEYDTSYTVKLFLGAKSDVVHPFPKESLRLIY